MGAVANMRPDLLPGVCADVPFVDVVTTMLDDDIPLTAGEYDEWGNPQREGGYRLHAVVLAVRQRRSARPTRRCCHHRPERRQVQYWEPAKWVAKLRARKTDQRPLLLSVNMDAGHGGVAGRFQAYRETALYYAFLLDRLGRADEAAEPPRAPWRDPARPRSARIDPRGRRVMAVRRILWDCWPRGCWRGAASRAALVCRRTRRPRARRSRRAPATAQAERGDDGGSRR